MENIKTKVELKIYIEDNILFICHVCRRSLDILKAVSDHIKLKQNIKFFFV
jgi:hypothetical protein